MIGSLDTGEANVGLIQVPWRPALPGAAQEIVTARSSNVAGMSAVPRVGAVRPAPRSGAIFAWALQPVEGEVRMPSRSSSLAKPQRHSILPEGESRSRRGEMPVGWDDPSRNVAHPPVAVSSRGSLLIPASLRHDMIRDAAYFRAQARGFVPGKEVEDWLAAEQDVEDLIARRNNSYASELD